MPEPQPIAYRALRRLVQLLVRIFFRTVETEGSTTIPMDRGGLLVAGHPNGLMDPALMLATFPGRLVFGARHGLFDWPMVGWMMRRLGTVPIYRAIDQSGMSAAERVRANQESLDGLAREIARGSFSALFPEGVSHDLPHLANIKTGAARLYYRARALRPATSPLPVILPVGLHYDRKGVFRSRVLVTFHPAMELDDALDVDPDPADGGARPPLVRELTARITERLDEVIGATDDWHLHHLLSRAGRLIRSELAHRAGARLRDPTLAEARLGYARVWRGFRARSRTDPERIEDIRRRLGHYDRTLRSLGLGDDELTEWPMAPGALTAALAIAQAIAVYLLMPIVLVAGVLVNVVPYHLLRLLTRKIAGEEKDEATIKLLGGAVLFPLFWTGAAVAAWFVHEELRALFPGLPDVGTWVVLAVLAAAVVGGWLALVYAELAVDTFRTVRARIRKRSRRTLVDDLIAQRSALCDALLDLGEGLDLPGVRSPDGRLRP